MPDTAAASDRQRVVIELDRGLLKRIDHISIDWDLYRKEAIERLLEMAVESVERNQAIPERRSS